MTRPCLCLCFLLRTTRQRPSFAVISASLCYSKSILTTSENAIENHSMKPSPFDASHIRPVTLADVHIGRVGHLRRRCKVLAAGEVEHVLCVVGASYLDILSHDSAEVYPTYLRCLCFLSLLWTVSSFVARLSSSKSLLTGVNLRGWNPYGTDESPMLRPSRMLLFKKRQILACGDGRDSRGEGRRMRLDAQRSRLVPSGLGSFPWSAEPAIWVQSSIGSEARGKTVTGKTHVWNDSEPLSASVRSSGVRCSR